MKNMLDEADLEGPLARGGRPILLGWPPRGWSLLVSASNHGQV